MDTAGFIEQIRAGEFSLCAPTGQPARAWTATERAECARVVRMMVEREKDGWIDSDTQGG